MLALTMWSTLCLTCTFAAKHTVYFGPSHFFQIRPVPQVPYFPMYILNGSVEGGTCEQLSVAYQQCIDTVAALHTYSSGQPCLYLRSAGRSLERSSSNDVTMHRYLEDRPHITATTLEKPSPSIRQRNLSVKGEMVWCKNRLCQP